MKGRLKGENRTNDFDGMQEKLKSEIGSVEKEADGANRTVNDPSNQYNNLGNNYAGAARRSKKTGH